MVRKGKDRKAASAASHKTSVDKLSYEGCLKRKIDAEAILIEADLWDLISAPLSSPVRADASDDRYTRAAHVLIFLMQDELPAQLTPEEQRNGQLTWHRVRDMYQSTGTMNMMTLRKKYSVLRYNPDRETFPHFIYKARALRNDMLDKEASLSHDMEHTVFVPSCLPAEIDPVIELWWNSLISPCVVC